MRRLCCFLMLALALPLQGYAHFAQPLVPCPMQAGAMMTMADGAATDDCCDEAQAAGQACESDPSCQSGGQHFSTFPPGPASPPRIAATRFPPLTATPPAFDPAAAWRPPARS